MILVTGAAGKTGRAAVAALARAGAATRALVHWESQSAQLAGLGAAQVVTADLLRLAEVRRALHGARAVYHICPNVNPNEVEIGRNVLASAVEAGVQHLVLHSVLHPQIEAMPHHWNKLRVEEMLIESALSFTILQPTAYMQNLLGGWERIVQDGVLRNPYPVETRLSLVDLQDVAQAAAIVLTQPGHLSATYELVGTPAHSQTEVARILEEALGRPVRAEAERIEEWAAKAAGVGAEQRTMLEAMFRHYAGHGLIGSSATLRWLLGREPTTLADFARRSRDVPVA